MFKDLLLGAFVCPPLIGPPLPPRPFTPAGVKGSWNSQFGFFGPDTGVDVKACDMGLRTAIGKRSSRSQRMREWGGSTDTLVLGARLEQVVSPLQTKFTPRTHAGVCKVSEANEHTRASGAIGRAEQRSGARIRAGACLSEASLRLTPGGASSARHPEGARPWARLSFDYFSLAKQRKVRPAAGSKPANGPKPEPDLRPKPEFKNIKQRMKC